MLLMSNAENQRFDNVCQSQARAQKLDAEVSTGLHCDVSTASNTLSLTAARGRQAFQNRRKLTNTDGMNVAPTGPNMWIRSMREPLGLHAK